MCEGVSDLNCDKKFVGLMHKYLDGDLTKLEENCLRRHLEDCEACQKHFHELKRIITLIQSSEQMYAPDGFKENVMSRLPKEKKRIGYIRWFKKHPILTAAAIFFIFMFSSVFSAWNGSKELVVSKQENLIIKGNTVIVPADVTVSGDLLVKNGNLKIEGIVDGNVILINGKLLENTSDGEQLMASVGEVNGEFKQVDQIFEWIWYRIKSTIKRIFALSTFQFG